MDFEAAAGSGVGLAAVPSDGGATKQRHSTASICILSVFSWPLQRFNMHSLRLPLTTPALKFVLEVGGQSNREIVSFRSCVRAKRGEVAWARCSPGARARRGSVCRRPVCPIRAGVVPWLSRGCPVVVPWLSRVRSVLGLSRRVVPGYGCTPPPPTSLSPAGWSYRCIYTHTLDSSAALRTTSKLSQSNDTLQSFSWSLPLSLSS